MQRSLFHAQLCMHFFCGGGGCTTAVIHYPPLILNLDAPSLTQAKDLSNLIPQEAQGVDMDHTLRQYHWELEQPLYHVTIP